MATTPNITKFDNRIKDLKTKIYQKHTEYLTLQAKGREAQTKGNENLLKLRILPSLVLLNKQTLQYIGFLKQTEKMRQAIINASSRKAAKGGKKNRRTVKNKRKN
jgi:hypothetical protein